MTLPHHLALQREAGGRPDSQVAAHAHAREWDAIMHPLPKLSRRRRIVYITVPVLALLGGLGWFWAHSPGSWTTDPSTPRGAVGAYIEALDRRGLWAAADLLCEEDRDRLVRYGFLETTAAGVRESTLEPHPALIWDAEPQDDGRFVVEVAVEGRSGEFVVVPGADGRYHVCGFGPDA